MVKFWKGLESLPPSMMVSKKELVLLLERRAAIEGAAAMTFHHDLDEGYRDDPPAQDEDDPAADPGRGRRPSRSQSRHHGTNSSPPIAHDAPLPEDHPKLIAAMVAWADDHNFDVEQLDGAPGGEVRSTAKNCRTKTVQGNIQERLLRKSSNVSGMAGVILSPRWPSLGFKPKGSSPSVST